MPHYNAWKQVGFLPPKPDASEPLSSGHLRLLESTVGRRAQPWPRAQPYNLRTGTCAIEAASSGVSKRSGWAFVSGVGGATGLFRFSVRDAMDDDSADEKQC